MAEVHIAKPENGQSRNIPSEDGAQFVFDFASSEATLARDGDNLDIRFGDGSNVRIDDFYTHYNAENLPSFIIEGEEVSAEDFFTAMNEPDLMPAAGPAATTATASGGRYRDYANSSLMDGIQHLDGLDWNMTRGFDHEYDPNSVGEWAESGGAAPLMYAAAPSNNPVHVSPDHPGAIAPGTPDFPVPGVPGGPGASNNGPTAQRDILLVHEKDLDGGNPVVRGGMNVDAPDGVGVITVGGVVVWENGVLTQGAEVRTDEGVLNNFQFDPATGKLTYEFTLEQATQEHRQPGEDSISHTFQVTVTDTDGDSDSSYISVVVTDDVPEAVDDVNSIGNEAKEPITGDVLDNDAFGADGKADVDYVALVGEPRGEYGTITLNPDGTYSFQLDTDNESVKELKPGETLEQEFKYLITDKDGDVSTATLTITINGTNHTPDIVPGDDPSGSPVGPNLEAASVAVDEAGLEHGTRKGDGSASATGSFSVNTHGEGGKLILSIGDAKIEIDLSKEDSAAGGQSIITPNGSAFAVNSVVNGVVNFTYELAAPESEEGEDRNIHKNAETIDIKLIDNIGNDETSGKINIDIKDDVPLLNLSHDNLGGALAGQEAQIHGKLDFSFGADNEGGQKSFTVFADGKDAVVNMVEGGETVVAGKYGVLTIHADNTYTYKANAVTSNDQEVGKDSFTFNIVDADGDIKSGTLEVTVGRPDGPSTAVRLEVDEHGLVDKSSGIHIVEISGIPDGYSIVEGDYSGTHGNISQVNGKWQYELTERVDSGEGQGANLQEQADTVPIKVQDAHGNIFDLNVDVAVKDDMDTLAVKKEATTAISEMQTQFKLDFVVAGQTPAGLENGKNGWSGVSTSGALGYKENIKVIATSVEYYYNDGRLEYMDDVNGWGTQGNISSDGQGGKYLTVSEDGLSVGKNDNSWGGVGSIGTKPNGLAAEGVVLETDNSTVSYGMNIEFGKFEQGDQAVITFMLTPRNNNDDSVVYTKIVKWEDFPKDAKGNVTETSLNIAVPDGFTKVIISAFPQGGTTNGATDFTIKNIEMERPSVVHSGQVSVWEGADSNGQEAMTWQLDDATQQMFNGNELVIHNTVGDGNYTAKYVQISDTEFRVVLQGSTQEVNLNGNPLLHGALKADGTWEIRQFYNFTIDDKKPELNLAFQIVDKDGDVDSALVVVKTDQQNVIDRFDNTEVGFWNEKWDHDANQDAHQDYLNGGSDNDLMYGRGGDDILFGDGGGSGFTHTTSGTVISKAHVALRDGLFTGDSGTQGAWDIGNITTGILAGTKPWGDGATNYEETNSYIDHYDSKGPVYDIKEGSIDLSKIQGAETVLNRLDNLESKMEEGIDGGNDALFGGIGNDILFGGAGDDYLDGGVGRDILVGGSGNDILVYDSRDYVISGGTGTDLVLAGSNAPSLKHMLTKGDGKGANPIMGGVEVLIRSMGTTHVENLGITSHASLAKYGVLLDSQGIYLTAAWKQIKGGVDGNLAYEYTLPDDTKIQLETVFAQEQVHTNQPADANGVILPPSAAADDSGIAPQDDIPADSNVLMDGQPDQISGHTAPMMAMNRKAAAEDGNADRSSTMPEVLPEGGAKPISGTENGDELNGADGNDIIYGGAGDDMLFGGAGDDVLYGGAGNDYLDGGAGRDYLYGEEGNDIILYDPTDYLIDGGEGIDVLLSTGNESLGELLTNRDPDKGTIVNDVEIMLKGDNVGSITNMNDLASLGIRIDEDGKSVELSGDWRETGSKSFGEGEKQVSVVTWENGGITMETTLHISENQSEAEQAAQAIMLSNG